jgi:hypothetical protein
MSDANPPPEVAAAAKIVDSWLKRDEPASRVSDAEYRAMSPAQRLEYSRSFDQRQFNNAKR